MGVKKQKNRTPQKTGYSTKNGSEKVALFSRPPGSLPP